MSFREFSTAVAGQRGVAQWPGDTRHGALRSKPRPPDVQFGSVRSHPKKPQWEGGSDKRKEPGPSTQDGPTLGAGAARCFTERGSRLNAKGGETPETWQREKIPDPLDVGMEEDASPKFCPDFGCGDSKTTVSWTDVGHVSACWGGYSGTPQTRGLKQHTSVLSALGAGKAKVKAPANPVPGERPLPGRGRPSSRRPHVAARVRGSLCRAPNPFMAPSPDLQQR